MNLKIVDNIISSKKKIMAAPPYVAWILESWVGMSLEA